METTRSRLQHWLLAWTGTAPPVAEPEPAPAVAPIDAIRCAMVRAMQQQFGSNPAELRAGIGPCISWENYEVDEPLVSEVKAVFADWATLLKKKESGGNGRYHFDLTEANRRNLARAGVRHIELSGLCTAARTDLFFSHRAERGKTGRFGSIFVLEGE